MIWNTFLCFLEGVTTESHPSNLVGRRGSGNRCFDFDELAEVQLLEICITNSFCSYVLNDGTQTEIYGNYMKILGIDELKHQNGGEPPQ